MRFSLLILLLCLLALFGCGKASLPSVPAPRTGGDVPTGGNVGAEQFLIYEDGKCVVVNGIFVQRSGDSLTLYGDSNCPHGAQGECTGATIATLTLGGTNAVVNCSNTYTLGSGSDSVSNFLTINVTQ